LRILVVKLSSLGDVIQTLPVLHDLHLHHPGVAIDWVVEESFAPLLGEVSGIAGVVAIAERRWRRRPFAVDVRAERQAFRERLREEAYDAVIDFQGLIKSALIARRARLSADGHRYTYANRSELCGYEWPVRYLVDRPIAMERRVHAVRRYRLLAARALGYDIGAEPDRVDWRFAATPGHDVLFAHGTTRADNEWPEDAWIALGRRLAAGGVRIVLPHSGADEAARVRRIAQAVGAGAEVLAPMQLDVLARRMALCRGVIGVDSGLSHLAVALDLAHVQIFSQPRVWRAGPVGRAWQVAVGGDAAPGVEEVLAAWQRACAALPGPTV
jgi:heptosyltransferase I